MRAGTFRTDLCAFTGVPCRAVPDERKLRGRSVPFRFRACRKHTSTGGVPGVPADRGCRHGPGPGGVKCASRRTAFRACRACRRAGMCQPSLGVPTCRHVPASARRAGVPARAGRRLARGAFRVPERSVSAPERSVFPAAPRGAFRSVPPARPPPEVDVPCRSEMSCPARRHDIGPPPCPQPRRAGGGP